MAILRVKDENGNIIEIPAIKGEKGDKGDPGDAANIDIQLNSTSIVQDGVANIPQMANGKFGVAQIWNAYGVDIHDNGYLMMTKADTNNINTRDANYRAIVPTNLDYAVKAALTDGKGQEYTPEEQQAARERIGAITINDIPIANQNTLGVVGIESQQGINAHASGKIYVNKAENGEIDARKNAYKPIVPTNLAYAVKSAMTSTTDDEWTEEEQLAARERLGVVDTNEIYIGADEMPEGCVLRINPEGEATPIVKDVKINDASVVADSVANIPLGAQNVYGVMKLGDNWYSGLEIDKNGQLKLRSLSTDHINNRSSYTSGVLHGANYDYAVKQALCDGKGPEWTTEEQKMAQKRIGSEQWRLIANAEITEAVRAIAFDKDIDGNALNLRKVMIYMKSIKSEDSTTTGNGRIFLNNTSPSLLFSGMSVGDNFAYSNIYFELLSNGLPLGYGTTSSTSLGQNPTLKTINLSPGFDKHTSIYKLKFDTDKQTALYGIGTTIEIWGVDV